MDWSQTTASACTFAAMGLRHSSLHTDSAIDEGVEVDLVAVDEALSNLSELYPRQAQVVEPRLLAGLSVEETAEELGIHPRTTQVDWPMARGRLSRSLHPDEVD